MQSGSRLISAIIVATGAAMAYLIGILLDVRFEWVYALFGLAVGACIWMTIRILRDSWSTDMTFDDYFYQDRPDIRRVAEE